MTRTQTQILDLFRTLADDEKRELATHLYETAVNGSFFDRMTTAQRAELATAIAEADRSEGVVAEEFFAEMAEKHRFDRVLQ